MNRNRKHRTVSAVLTLILAIAPAASAEWKEKVLYSFQGGTNDGSVPAGGVVFDKQGNLYGATTGGGPSTCAPFGSECGTVFQLSPPAQKGGSWTETLIYQFQGKGSNDGSVPNGGLIIDAAGNLYGVTAYGGTGYCLLLGSNAGCGTVYKISPPQQQGGAWTETILYSFATAKEGYLAIGNLVFDGAGNLYGATWFGGDKGTTCDSLYGGQCGVVFELSPPKQHGGKWTEKVLHSFGGARRNGRRRRPAERRFGGRQQGRGLRNDVHGRAARAGSALAEGLRHGVQAHSAEPEGREVGTKQPSPIIDGQDRSNSEAGVVFDGSGNLYGTPFAVATKWSGLF